MNVLQEDFTKTFQQCLKVNLILPIYDILEKNKKNWYDNHKMLRVVNSKLEFQPSVVQAGFVGYIYIEN